MPSEKPKESYTLKVNQSFIDPKTDKETQLGLAKYELIYAVIGQILGLASIIGGITLFLNGIAGTTSWTAKILGAESTITDAAPGAIFIYCRPIHYYFYSLQVRT
jgi:hypothetical protein